MIFWEEKRLEFIARYPRLTPKEINVKISQTWEFLEPEKKKQYSELSKQEWTKYTQQMRNMASQDNEEPPSKKRKVSTNK